MKKIVYTLFMLMPLMLLAQSNTSGFELDIKILGLCSDNGKVRVEVLRSNDSIFKTLEGTISDKMCVLHIDSVPQGEYMVQYYHDANDNKKMDSNFIGIPKEGYGFSNNPDSKFGPPPAEEMRFMVNQSLAIELKTVQW